ncbi:uncharacterized protein F5147DRAFT_768032 [Suillus discolor]|uniref:Uncharacterized protein n=1 Tax=Suillus discolor TaxID=1912936 RepID=A0A9P7JZF9_9AGAM|nr:uncharacterized protein F5147DRAFT_768032 [Suillus discolor]KAG2117890.1 hypothetical protein F5147DRAFT_768032 [Suillus discolor]
MLDNHHVPHLSNHGREHYGYRAGHRPSGGSASCTFNPFANHAPPPSQPQAPTMTAAQLIAAVVKEEACNPTIVLPPPSAPVLDPGPDVSEIIDTVKHLDLERAARVSKISNTDFFDTLSAM